MVTDEPLPGQKRKEKKREASPGRKMSQYLSGEGSRGLTEECQ